MLCTKTLTDKFYIYTYWKCTSKFFNYYFALHVRTILCTSENKDLYRSPPPNKNSRCAPVRYIDEVFRKYKSLTDCYSGIIVLV